MTIKEIALKAICEVVPTDTPSAFAEHNQTAWEIAMAEERIAVEESLNIKIEIEKWHTKKSKKTTKRQKTSI